MVKKNTKNTKNTKVKKYTRNKSFNEKSHFTKLVDSIFLSRSDLARELGITIGALSHYECNTRQPRIDIAYRLIDVAKTKGVNISLEDIYER